jgi:flagellar hook-associated protein 1 FlgK
MSIGNILSNASTGLMAAQAGLRTVSDNVANANTPGYVRKVVNQSSLSNAGQGAGVSVDGVRRVVDRYLESASLTASSASGKAGVLSELLDRAQGLFGDPSGNNTYFDKLSETFNQFAALANDPSSALQRNQALSSTQAFFDDTSRVANSLSAIQQDADTRIKSDVGRVNDLLGQIAQLNDTIRKGHINNGDASGSENIQSQLITELSGLIDVGVTQSADGGTVVRTPDGMLLADKEAGTIGYNQSGSAAGYLSVTPAQGGGRTFDANFSSGEIVGLLQTRNKEIPDALSQLLELSSNAAEQLNAASNASSAVPAPADLTGKNTGMDINTAISGFSGDTTVALINSAGVIQHKIAINFDSPQTITVDGGTPAAFTTTSPTNFMTVLNGALTPLGASATFTNGAMSLHTNTGGVAVVDDATTPSTKAGQGFSQFFGLNDLVRSSGLNPDTGLSPTDASGVTSGSITLRLAQDNGTRVRDVIVTPTPGGDMASLVAQLNSSTGGVSPFGAFSLDTNGRLSFASASSPQVSLSVVSDTTARGVGGPNLTTTFGLGIGGKAAMASSFAVRPEIYQNPALLATAKVNLSAAAGVVALSPGDGRGAQAMAQAGEQTTTFAAAGDLPATRMSLSRYATEFAGSLGRKAAAAETAMTSADSIKTEADSRLSSYEGVNTDEELIKLTQYQQAFNASARMITAANQMYDTLLQMI